MVESVSSALDIVILVFSISGIIILTISLLYKLCTKLVIPSLWKFGLYMLDVTHLFLAIGLTLFVAHTKSQDTTTCETSGFFIVFAMLQCPCSFLSAGIVISFVQCPGKSLHTSKYHKNIFMLIMIPVLFANVVFSMIPLIPIEYFDKTSPYPIGCLPLRPLPHSGSEYALFIYLLAWVLMIAAGSFCIVSVLKVWKTFSNRIHSAAAASNVLQTQNINQGRTWQKILLFEESLWIVVIFITTLVEYTNTMETDVATWIIMTSMGVTVIVHSIFTIAENVLWGSCCCKTSQNNRESARKLKKLELVKVDGHGRVRMRAMWALERGMVKKGLMKIYGVNHLKLWAQEIMVLGMLRKAQHSSLLQCQWTSRNNPYYETMTLITGEIITFDSRIICMELTNGGTMKDFLKRMQLSLPETCQRTIVHDIAEGLSHLHSRNILHRNLTSSSIYLKGSIQHMVLRAAIGDFEEAEIYGSLQNGDSNFGSITKKEFLLPDIRSFALVTLELLSRSCEKRLNDRSGHVQSEHIPLMMTFANAVSPPETHTRTDVKKLTHNGEFCAPTQLGGKGKVLDNTIRTDTSSQNFQNKTESCSERNKKNSVDLPKTEEADIPFSDELFDIPTKHIHPAPRFGNNASALPVYNKMANLFSANTGEVESNPSDIDDLINEEIDYMTQAPVKARLTKPNSSNDGSACNKFEILPDAMYPDQAVSNSIKEVLDNSWDSDSTDSFLQYDNKDGKTHETQKVLSKTDTNSSVGTNDNQVKAVSRTCTGSSVGTFSNVDISEYLPGIITENDSRRFASPVGGLSNTGKSAIAPIQEDTDIIPGTAEYVDEIGKSTLSLQEMIAAREHETNISGKTVFCRSHILSNSVEEQELEIDDERPDNGQHYSVTPSPRNSARDNKLDSKEQRSRRSTSRAESIVGIEKRQKARKVLSKALTGKSFCKSKTSVISLNADKTRGVIDERNSSVKKLHSETKSNGNPLTQHIKANIQKPAIQSKKPNVKSSSSGKEITNKKTDGTHSLQESMCTDVKTTGKRSTPQQKNEPSEVHTDKEDTVSCISADCEDLTHMSNAVEKHDTPEGREANDRDEKFENVQKECEYIIESIQNNTEKEDIRDEYAFLKDALMKRSRSEGQCDVPGAVADGNSHVKRITVTPKNFSLINGRKGISFDIKNANKRPMAANTPVDTPNVRESSFSSDDEETSSGCDARDQSKSKLKQRIHAKGKSKIKRTLTPLNDTNAAQDKKVLHKSWSDSHTSQMYSSFGSSNSSASMHNSNNAQFSPSTSTLPANTMFPLSSGNESGTGGSKPQHLQGTRRLQDSGIESGSVTSDLSRVNTPVEVDRVSSSEGAKTQNCPIARQPIQNSSSLSKPDKRTTHGKQFNGGVNVFSNNTSNATKRYRELTKKGVPLKVSVIDVNPSSVSNKAQEGNKRQRIVINVKKSASFEEEVVEDSDLNEVYKQLDDKGVFHSNPSGTVPREGKCPVTRTTSKNRLNVVQGHNTMVPHTKFVARQPLDGIIKEIPDETSDAYDYDSQTDDHLLHQPTDGISVMDTSTNSVSTSHTVQTIRTNPHATALVVDSELVIDRIFSGQSHTSNYGGTDSEADSGMGLDEDTIRTLTRSSLSIKHRKNIDDVTLSVGMEKNHFKYCQDLSNQTHLLAFNDLLPAHDDNFNIMASKLKQAGKLGTVGKQILDLIGECWLSENPPNAETIVTVLTDPVSETEL